MPSDITNSNFDYLQDLKTISYPHYFCLLLSNGKTRQLLAKLWHHAAEIRRITTLTNDPIAGYIRLTWWRDQMTLCENNHLNLFIEYINSFESWFESETVDQLLIFAQTSELHFFRQTIKLLNLPEDSDYLYHLGQCFGLILTAQSQNSLRFSLTPEDHRTIIARHKESLMAMKKCHPDPRIKRLLKPLEGYLNLWENNYQGHPITFGEPSIQWQMLRQKLLR